MRVTQSLTKTLRHAPAEADTISHQLLLRAGMVYQVAAGAYAYLPLAWRSLRKIEQIIREEMDAAGGQELMMPALQPLELWQKTGRASALGQTLFTFKDRRERELCLGATHEEVVTEIVRHNVQSYRDLPLMPYQMQTKFRDEVRPRGGLLRAREFTMLDLYSFDIDQAGADLSYNKMITAYNNIFKRCGLNAIMVEADSGAIGGKDSHEFMVIAESGEDNVIRCAACDYAANSEKAQSAKSRPEKDEEPLPVQEVATPGARTIEEVAAFLGVPRSRTLKAVFYTADGKMVLAMVRGDLEVNEVKLKNALKAAELRLASDEEVRAAGLVAGAASPVGLSGVRVLADDSITLGANFVAGANKPGRHLKNINYPRDFQAERVLDIALAGAGQRCLRCGGELQVSRGIEAGHIFKLGTLYSEKLGAFILDQEGNQKPIIMGCYGIGVGRLLAAAVESNHDDKGIIWPAPIAPYSVYLCSLGAASGGGEVAAAADVLYEELKRAGIEVLYDDRQESAGVKFNDADLLGLPLRLTVSARTLKAGNVELKMRSRKESELAPREEAVTEVRHLLGVMQLIDKLTR